MKHLKFLCLVIGALSLGACLPEPPNAQVVQSTRPIAGGMDLYRMNRQWEGPALRNAILVTADSYMQDALAEPLMKAYHSRTAAEAPRIEDIAWWTYAPNMRRLYDQVLRIRHDHFNKESLFSALRKMERTRQPYDLFIFSHGMLDSLVASEGQPWVTYQDIDELKGKLKYLNLVFMQSCRGESLAPDWIDAGARDVLAFSRDHDNMNFFYLGFFLRAYARHPNDIPRAYAETNSRIGPSLHQSLTYRKIIEGILHKSVDQYIAEGPNPGLLMRP